MLMMIRNSKAAVELTRSSIYFEDRVDGETEIDESMLAPSFYFPAESREQFN